MSKVKTIFLYAFWFFGAVSIVLCIITSMDNARLNSAMTRKMQELSKREKSLDAAERDFRSDVARLRLSLSRFDEDKETTRSTLLQSR